MKTIAPKHDRSAINRNAGTRNETIALAALTLASLTLFLVRAGDLGYWYDELWSVDAVTGTFGRMLDRLATDVHPPGYHVVLWLWTHVFGTAEFATHALSAVCFAAAVPFVYGIGRRLELSRAAAFGAAAVTGFGYASINYALESRPYAWLVLLTTAALWPVTGAFTRRRFALAFGIGVLGLYSHYAIVFTAVPAVVWLTLRRRDWGWLWLPAAWAAALLPWVANFVAHAGRYRQMGWLQPPTLDDGMSQLSFFVGLPYGAWIFGVLAAAVLAAALLRRAAKDMWLLVFPSVFGGLFLVSLVAQPLFHQRYLLPLVPWFALSIGFLVDRVPRRALKWGFAAGVGAIAIFSAQYFFVHKAEDWRAPARYVEARRVGAPVVTTDTAAFFRHYFPDIIVFADGDAAAVQAWLRENAGAEVWLVQARGYKATPATTALAQGSEILEITEFPGTRALRLAVHAAP